MSLDVTAGSDPCPSPLLVVLVSLWETSHSWACSLASAHMPCATFRPLRPFPLCASLLFRKHPYSVGFGVACPQLLLQVGEEIYPLHSVLSLVFRRTLTLIRKCKHCTSAPQVLSFHTFHFFWGVLEEGSQNPAGSSWRVHLSLDLLEGV